MRPTTTSRWRSWLCGREREAERNLYYIWPQSAYYGEREYHLGRLALLAGDRRRSAQPFPRAVTGQRG